MEFDVQGRVTQINPGPVVTTFEFKPEAGIKYSRIIGLADDLCLALQAESILIERIPGKSTIGIEVPNLTRQTIALREIDRGAGIHQFGVQADAGDGKDLLGRIRVADLAQMPHLLIAGSTGTGKSVFINSLMMSMLYKATPDEVKLVLVDPKRLELNLYENIPHLLAPVVTDPKVAANVLRNATREMERRLKLLAQRGVRNIDQYNRTFQKQQSLSLFDNVKESEHKPLPYLVIVIDELADLMMVDTNNVEESITRLAQMARAVGIHLILATQRPSVDVITGLDQGEFPGAHFVPRGQQSGFAHDSRCERLGIAARQRRHAVSAGGIFAAAPHSRAVGQRRRNRGGVRFLARAGARPSTTNNCWKPPKDEERFSGGVAERSAAEARRREAMKSTTTSIRMPCAWSAKWAALPLPRCNGACAIGYGRAARLIDLMEKDGIVGPPDGTKPREVLKKKEWMREFDQHQQS